MVLDDEIQASILHQLARKDKWLHNHIPYDRIKKWVVAGLRGQNGKRTEENLKKLIKANLVLAKPTSYGLEISLNIELREEILNRIKMFYP